MVRRPFGSVSFGVGHSSDNHQVFILNVNEPFLESLQVIRSVFLIGLISDGIDGVDAIESNASLKTGPRLLPQQSKQFNLLDQVFDILMDMSETAYRVAGQVGGGRRQITVFLFAR